MNFLEEKFEDELQFDINVIPLIDVLLVLLIFFMVSSSFVASGGLDVKLPASTNKSTSGADTATRVTVLKDGTIELGEEKVSSEELTKRLSELATKGNTTVVIRADEKSEHGSVVAAMDAIKAAGIDKLSIATVPKTQNQ